LGKPHNVGRQLVADLNVICSRNPEPARHGSHVLVPRHDDAVLGVAVRHPEAHEIVCLKARLERSAVLVVEVLADALKAERLAHVLTVRLVRLVDAHAERPRGVAHGNPKAARLVVLHPR